MQFFCPCVSFSDELIAMRQLPPLAALRAFEAIARTGSVTRAAEELCRSHGAISRHLRLLQEHAGAALFEEEGTGLRLTEAGVSPPAPGGTRSRPPGGAIAPPGAGRHGPALAVARQR